MAKYRKKGLGTELTTQTLNYEIAHKHYKFILAASDLGLIIYKKLGFKPVETIYEYKLMSDKDWKITVLEFSKIWFFINCYPSCVSFLS